MLRQEQAQAQPEIERGRRQSAERERGMDRGEGEIAKERGHSRRMAFVCLAKYQNDNLRTFANIYFMRWLAKLALMMMMRWQTSDDRA